MNILVSGGAGYIGSHTCVALLEAGYNVIVADNLRNGKIERIDKVKKITNKEICFYQVDVTDKESVNKIFFEHSIDGLIHFAGLKSVNESSKEPLDYYYNNIVSSIVLAEACQSFGVNRFIFSSSAAVYGENQIPFIETMKTSPTETPYGESKAMSERILNDVSKADPDISIALLRYFNPVGAHDSGFIGEASEGIPNNLMPYITSVAKGKQEKLLVFGDDYPTKDGTGVRDYIHVMDLAESHVMALEKVVKGAHVYNLGTGKGTSVLELINTFEETNNIKIPYKITDRRAGDISVSYADVSKAKRELGWEAKRGIISMCQDAWRFEKTGL